MSFFLLESFMGFMKFLKHGEITIKQRKFMEIHQHNLASEQQLTGIIKDLGSAYDWDDYLGLSGAIMVCWMCQLDY